MKNADSFVDEIAYRFTIYDINTYFIIDPNNELNRRLAMIAVSCNVDPKWARQFNRQYIEAHLDQELWVAYAHQHIEKIVVKSVNSHTWNTQFKSAMLENTKIINEECCAIYKMCNLNKTYYKI